MQPDPLAPFRWLADAHSPLDSIFCVSFCRGLTPAEVLRRFGADAPLPERMRFAELLGRVGEFVEQTQGGDGGGYVGVVQLGDWSVAVEPWGWRGALTEVATVLSAAAESVTVSRHDYAEDDFVHAVDGAVVTAFGLGMPGMRHGSAPDRLNAAMAQVGLDPRGETRRSEHRIAAAFALAAQVTGVSFTPDVLEMPLFVGDLRGPAA